MRNVKRGFVTIATGNEKYYQLAANLLKSYRIYCKDDTPFAIICDRKMPQTEAFDEVIVLPEVHRSYLEKLYLYINAPYDETIFVDADALFLADPGLLWKDFERCEDFSCYGHTIPLESKDGWFEYEKTGEYQPYIHYGVQMHGGLYFLRKTQQCREIFQRAISIAEHYQDYGFAHFSEPADEPVLALSMAISGCRPCPEQDRITFLISYEGRLNVRRDGQLMMDRKPYDTVILHIATSNVNRFIYRFLTSCMWREDLKMSKREYWILKIKCLPQDIKIPLMRRIKRFVKYSVSPQLYENLRKISKMKKQ